VSSKKLNGMEATQQSNTTYEEPQPQQQAPSTLSGKRLLIGLGVLVVILVIVLAITGKSSQPQVTPEPTSVAETSPTTPVSTGVYNNQTTGISFAHPPHVIVNDISSDIITISTSSPSSEHGDDSHGADDPHGATGAQISTFPGNKVADQLSLTRDLFITPYVKDIEIDGVVAKEISGYGKGMLEGKFIRFVEIYHGGKTYELSYFEGDPGFSKEDFDQIVTSFKFTNKN
jgi:hypothetical protein